VRAVAGGGGAAHACSADTAPAPPPHAPSSRQVVTACATQDALGSGSVEGRGRVPSPRTHEACRRRVADTSLVCATMAVLVLQPVLVAAVCQAKCRWVCAPRACPGALSARDAARSRASCSRPRSRASCSRPRSRASCSRPRSRAGTRTTLPSGWMGPPKTGPARRTRTRRCKVPLDNAVGLAGVPVHRPMHC
jgi:hypothetical protein